jgi:DNA-binding NarL/FixJ family response regulator
MNSQSSSNRARVLLVDAHPLMRKGIVELIAETPDLEVCGECTTAGEALACLEKSHPDLVVTSLNLPGRNGLELIKDISATRHPAPPVIVFSSQDESFYAERVLRSGGRGYVMKTESGKTLLKAIHHVLGGQLYVSETMASKILVAFSGKQFKPGNPHIENLSDREFQVFRLIGNGMNTREIATHLHLSPKTVEIHRSRIKSKLKLKTAPELLRYAIRWLGSESES